jgi:hypothetical protein
MLGDKVTSIAGPSPVPWRESVRLSRSATWFPAKLLGGAGGSQGNGRLANAAGPGGLDLDRGERRSLSRASASRAQAGSRGWLEIPTSTRSQHPWRAEPHDLRHCQKSVSDRELETAEAQHFAALIAHGSFSSMPVLEVTSSAISRSRRQLAGL